TPSTAFRSGNPYGSSNPAAALVLPAGPSQGLFSSLGDGQSFDQRNRAITRVQHYSFGIQRELPFGIVLDAAYVGTYTSDIRVGVNYDSLTPTQIAQCAASAAASTGGVNGLCSQSVKNPFLNSLNGTTAANSTLNTRATVVAWTMM